MNHYTDFSVAKKILGQAIAARVFPGAVFGAWHEGNVLVQAVGSFGYEPHWPVATCDTIYDLASITKVMATTALAMKLWQDDKFRLETPVCELLPQFAGDDPRRAQVTLAMLLAHTSGLPAYRELYLLPEVASATDAASRRAAVVKAACATPLVAEPGARDEYSDIGFLVLGEALAAIGGAPLQQLFQDTVAAPLGLKTATYLPQQSLRASIAPGCDWRWRHRVIQGEVQDENCAAMGGVSGHAGLFSDCDDVLDFAGAVMDEQFFARATLAKFAQRVSGSRALGWDTPSGRSQSGQYFSPHSLGHLGYTGTSLWMDLDRRIAIALLTNRCYTGSTAPPLQDREAILQVRPSFHDAVMREILDL